MVKDQQQHKEEETKRIVKFIEENDLQLDNINIDLCVSQGAEKLKFLFSYITHWKGYFSISF